MADQEAADRLAERLEQRSRQCHQLEQKRTGTFVGMHGEWGGKVYTKWEECPDGVCSSDVRLLSEYKTEVPRLTQERDTLKEEGAAAALEIMALLGPVAADAAIVGRSYGWREVLGIVRAAKEENARLKARSDELEKVVMLAVLNIDCGRNGLTQDGNVRERLVASLEKESNA